MPAVADYLTEPPSNLPPAIVAYLIDEAPSVKGALASLFHLANLGLLWIRLGDELAVKRVAEKSLVAGAPITLPSGETVSLPTHLVTLFNALQPALPYQEEVPLNRVYTQFQSVLPQVYAQMGDETSHFFDETPTEARHRWLVRGQWFILLGVIAGVILALRYFGDFGWLSIAPAVAAIVAGFALVIASRWMPRRTTAGVEEAQRWRAFRTYLQNLQQYGNVEQAQRILDRYFAYAVALDVDDSLVGVVLTDGTRDVMLVSSDGKAIRFAEQEVRPMGRVAHGVRGLRLIEGQTVIALIPVDPARTILLATENGYGKQTRVDEFPVHGRGGQGVIAIQTSARNGQVIGAAAVAPDEEIMLISDGGTLVRTPVEGVSVVGRNTQGVRLITLGEGEKLVGMEPIAEVGNGESGDAEDVEPGATGEET